MKKIIIFVCFLILTSVLVYSEDPDCSDITYPDGWDSGETGWVLLQLNDYIGCTGKICYCHNLDTLDEGPHFWIKKIIWKDSTCYPDHYTTINNNIFKLGLITELIRIHQDEIPIRFCPDSWYPTELYTTFCYAAYYEIPSLPVIDKYPVCIPCDGDGYCAQAYQYCWDNTQTPWVLDVVKSGPSISYGSSDCYLPFTPGPNYELIHPCIPWCDY
jgi:hypothetical protein